MSWPDFVPLQTGVGVGGITYEGDKDGGEMLLKNSGKLVYTTTLYKIEAKLHAYAWKLSST